MQAGDCGRPRFRVNGGFKVKCSGSKVKGLGFRVGGLSAWNGEIRAPQVNVPTLGPSARTSRRHILPRQRYHCP